jgi:hypothetical protein
MNYYRRHVLLVLCLALLSGCAGIVGRYDTAPVQELCYSLTMTIHVVTNRSQIPLQHPDIVGAWRHGEIWVIASPRNGQYYIDPCVIGHEILHELHSLDARIPNPDTIVVRFR